MLLPVPEHLCSHGAPVPRPHPRADPVCTHTLVYPVRGSAAVQANEETGPWWGLLGEEKVSTLTEFLLGAGSGCPFILKGPGKQQHPLYLGGDRGAGWGSRHSWFGSRCHCAVFMAPGGHRGGAAAWCQGAACVLTDSPVSSAPEFLLTSRPRDFCGHTLEATTLAPPTPGLPLPGHLSGGRNRLVPGHGQAVAPIGPT